jgi:hypothetical protein
MYTVELDGGSKAMTLAVADKSYVGDADLHRFLRVYLDNVGPGATITTATDTDVDGHRALDGRYTMPLGGQEFSGFVRLVDDGKFIVYVMTAVPAADEAVGAQMHQQAVSTLKLA